MRKIKKSTKILLFVIISLSFFLNLISFKKGHTWGDDFALYIAQAKSLVENSVKSLIEQQMFLEQYSSELHGPLVYPWGFPVLLAPVYKIFGFDIVAMKIYVFLFFIGSLFILFYFFEDRISERFRLLLVSIFALNPVFFYFKEYVLADVPFLFFTLLGMWMIKLYIIEKRFMINRYISLFLLGFVCFFAYFIKIQGFVLFVILFLCHIREYIGLLSNKDSKLLKERCIHLIPYATIALCYLLYRVILYEKFDYFVYVLFNQDIISTIKNNFIYYFFLPSEFFSSKIALKFIYFVTIPFALYGFMVNFKRDYPFALFMIFNIIILLVFPFTTQGIRYIIFIMPFYFYYFVKGFFEFKKAKSNRPFRKFCVNMMYILMAVLIFSYILRDINYVRKVYKDNWYTYDGPYSENATEMINFIRNNTKDDDKIVFFKPRALRLYTNRRTVVNYKIDDIASYGFKYVVVYKNDVEHAYRIKFKDDIDKSKLFKKIFENDEFRIYEFNMASS
ncbi:MAG TPA: phospholipid carrier-dependent glycosyltransferase [Syntrophorhabdaceae bacterium]|nr:phospholipid carrier-dependent glycosyltransferase [Syntrophorhabdaceae bacterium]HOL04743.1 phospholipid carrier-dependent glycosyltransferase [Syntrophorhabdaceae bacterium]HQG78903.1 phospholipid carrier-dependent glycosyltransferase [bacterium]